MVKKRVGGAHRYKAVKAAAAAAAGHDNDPQQQRQQQKQEDGPKPPSHLQRKITKSVKFYEKVLASGAPKAPQGVLKKTKKKRSSKTLASLDSLAAELSNIPTGGGSSSKGGSGSLSEQQAALLLRGKGTKSSIKRSKARLAVGVSESTRLQKVLQHPAYKSDPIQAVMNHLLNTLPAAPQQQQQQQQRKQGGSGQQQQQKRRKKQKQGAGGTADMED